MSLYSELSVPAQQQYEENMQENTKKVSKTDDLEFINIIIREVDAPCFSNPIVVRYEVDWWMRSPNPSHNSSTSTFSLRGLLGDLLLSLLHPVRPHPGLLRLPRLLLPGFTRQRHPPLSNAFWRLDSSAKAGGGFGRILSEKDFCKD